MRRLLKLDVRFLKELGRSSRVITLAWASCLGVWLSLTVAKQVKIYFYLWRAQSLLRQSREVVQQMRLQCKFLEEQLKVVESTTSEDQPGTQIDAVRQALQRTIEQWKACIQLQDDLERNLENAQYGRTA